MLTRKPWRLVPVLVAASTVTVLCATALPAVALPAVALPVTALPGSATAATALALEDFPLPEATADEKYKAAVIVDAGDDLAMQEKADCDFVHEVSRRAAGSVVTQEAITAVDSGSVAACTQFIRRGIFDANVRDRAIQQRDRAERDARQAAAAAISLAATPRLLGMTNYNFVVEVVLHAPGPLVKAAAEAALRADNAAALTEFITAGIFTNQRQDQLNKIDVDNQKTEAEKEAERQKDARRSALATIGVVATPEMLVLDDTNFIYLVLNRAVKGSEVALAADAVLATFDPAKRQVFILTGIYEAVQADFVKNRAKDAEANRTEARQIQATAENSLVHPALAAAAKAALAGTDADVSRFLGEGKDTAIVQSLQTYTPARKGWHLRATPAGVSIAASGTGANKAVTDGTFRIVPGLGDASCHSMESTTAPGYYLRENANRVVLAADDTSAAFRTAATWCARAGKVGTGVSLESRSKPGRFLRHFGTALYAAQAATVNDYDRPCGFNGNATWTVGGTATPAVAAPGTGEHCGFLDDYRFSRFVSSGNPHEGPVQPPVMKDFYGLVQTSDAGVLRTQQVDGAKRTLTAGEALSATPWTGMGEFVMAGLTFPPVLSSSSLIAIERSTGKLWLYPQEMNPEPRVALGNSGWNGMRELTTGEFSDNNARGGNQILGNRELLAVERSTGILWAYPATDSDTLGARIQIGSGWSDYDKLTVGNFGGSEHNDLLAVERATGKLWIYPGKDGDGLGARILLGASGWNAYTQLATMEVTGDDKTDLIAVDELGKKWLYPNAGPAKLSTRIALTEK